MIIFVSKISDNCGDVTCLRAYIPGQYTRRYAVFPQAGGIFINSEIPVDNWEFSTFSTDFSTRVFHRENRLWIFTGGSHNQAGGGIEIFPLFGEVVFFTMAETLCKN